jgi:hypothetical protein
MAVKQYLFRCYHDPISEEGRDWSDVLDGNIALTLNQTELYHSDFICSLNEETAELSQQASMLVYAQSILTIKANTWCVVVWELNDEAGVTHQTPVIVLHPYLDPNIAPPLYERNEIEFYFPVLPLDGTTIDNDGSTYDVLGGSFFSYQLYDPSHGPGNNYQFPDPWLVANIARDVTSGRYQLQYVKKAIAVEDYFYSRDDTLVLNMDGSLNLTRFPLWKLSIESLPQGHSGYSMDVRGKLTPQPHALTRRVLNGVTNMAQQRRMFIRRDWAINVVAAQWHITAKKFLAWMWYNDQFGYQSAEVYIAYQNNLDDRATLTATDVPDQFLIDNLPWLVRFLNLVNVAQGDTGLACALPGQTAADLEIEYQTILDKLRDSDGVVRRYAVREIAEHHAIFRHAVDLTNGMMERLVSYHTGLYEYEQSPQGSTNAEKIARANIYVTIKNNFALSWPGLVADFYSVFCLLMSWQLTWNIAERTRGEDATDVLRNRKPVFYPKWQQRLKPVYKRDVEVAIDLEGDFARRRPHFVPYRTWDVQLYDSGFDQALADAQAQARQEASEAWLQQQAQLKSQHGQARVAERADWHAGVPNPDDPWDFRNYSSLAWWKQKAQEPLNVEFTLRALDVPNELFSWSGIALGAVRNYIPAFSSQSDAAGFNERIIPSGVPISALGLPIVTILINDTLLGTSSATPYQIVGDVAGLLADYAGTNDETYSPRQFWAPINFTW